MPAEVVDQQELQQQRNGTLPTDEATGGGKGEENSISS
jgi:hypothetical protein